MPERNILIFLSHASSDKSLVRRVNRDLQSRTFQTWLDEEKILFGQSIVSAIQAGLFKSDIMLIFLSRSSVASRWTTDEWQSTFYKQINENKIIVVPILVEDCEIPHLLAERKYVDFRRREEYETNLSQLLSYLERIRSEKERVPECRNVQDDHPYRR